MKRTKWTEEELNILKEGHSLNELIQLLDRRTKNSIQTKCSEQNIKIIRDDMWTELGDNFLKDNYSIMTHQEMANLLNKSKDYVSKKCATLGLKKANKTVWEKWHIDFLKDNYNNMNFEELAKAIHKTPSSVATKAKKLGFRKHYSTKWETSELDILVKYYPISNMETLLNLLPNRTPEAIRTMSTTLKLYKTEETYSEIMLELSKRVKCSWTEDKNKLLIDSFDKDNPSDIYDLFPFNRKYFLDGKMQQLGLIEKSDRQKASDSINDIENITLQEILILYRKILNGEISGFKICKPTKSQLIICFKYYLHKNNIKYNRDFWLNSNLHNLLDDTKLLFYVYDHYESGLDFICHCFPMYNFKYWEFTISRVPDDFWLNKYNRIHCIRDGVNNLIRDNLIKKPIEILNVGINLLAEYTHSSLKISKYGVMCILEYLDFYKIDYSKYRSKIYDGILFDSKEERDVYAILLSLHYFIEKCSKKIKFYNAKYNENYIPDFILTYKNYNIIIEYFGLYNEKALDGLSIDYVSKTKRKNEFYETLDNFLFIAIYPDDLKRNYNNVIDKVEKYIANNCI